MNIVFKVAFERDFWLHPLSVPAKMVFVTFSPQASLNALVLIKNQDYEN